MWRRIILPSLLALGLLVAASEAPCAAACRPMTYTETTILPDGRLLVCVVTVYADCSTTRMCL